MVGSYRLSINIFITNIPLWFPSVLKLTSRGPTEDLGVTNILDTGGHVLAGALGGRGALKGVLFL